MTVNFYRDKVVDNEQGWHWISSDVGAWNIPKYDWEESHRHRIDKHVKNRRVVVQAGGNLGMYPRLLAKRFGLVYTFEPDPLNHYVLTLNCDMDNIVKNQAAIGDKNTMISVKRNTMVNVGMHQVIQTANSYIPQFKLDDFHFSTVDLLMLDLEGYEAKALAGATRILSQFKPVVFVERPDENARKILTTYGYELVEMSREDGIFIHTA